MKPGRWHAISRLYHDALQYEPGARSEFLRRACSGDEDLQREIESLLSRDSSEEGLLATRALSTLLAGCEARPLLTIDIGTRLGRYRVERQLGQGGMGIVFLARDDVLQRRLAI